MDTQEEVWTIEPHRTTGFFAFTVRADRKTVVMLPPSTFYDLRSVTADLPLRESKHHQHKVNVFVQICHDTQKVLLAQLASWSLVIRDGGSSGLINHLQLNHTFFASDGPLTFSVDQEKVSEYGVESSSPITVHLAGFCRSGLS